MDLFLKVYIHMDVKVLRHYAIELIEGMKKKWLVLT